MKEYSDPRMHSAEHILNQTMVRMFDCGRCFRAHIEKKKSKCDYHFDRPLTDREIEDIQSRVNRVIESDLPVQEKFLPREEAQAQYTLDRLPEEAGDRIRIITVGDYDACPCIGPHVKSTRDIGTFRILSSSFEDGVLRIRFKVVG
jgi:misacylated tRNA(Ala) deacylase